MDRPLPPDDPWARPAGVDDATVEATGKLSEALEWVERARGHLYEFHQLMGRAWEGNVRELRNMIERACILADGGWVTERELKQSTPRSSSSRGRPTPWSG